MIKLNSIILLTLTLVACSEQKANSQQPSTIKSPSSAAASPKKIIKRAENCLHFSREFAGDQSARDKELNHKMDQLKCDTIISELETLQQQLPKDSPLKPKVRALLQEYN